MTVCPMIRRHPFWPIHCIHCYYRLQDSTIPLMSWHRGSRVSAIQRPGWEEIRYAVVEWQGTLNPQRGLGKDPCREKPGRSGGLRGPGTGHWDVLGERSRLLGTFPSFQRECPQIDYTASSLWGGAIGELSGLSELWSYRAGLSQPAVWQLHI